MAEAIFNKAIRNTKLESKCFADSAGTSTYHIGEPPDERSMANALRNGVKCNTWPGNSLLKIFRSSITSWPWTKVI